MKTDLALRPADGLRVFRSRADAMDQPPVSVKTLHLPRDRAIRLEKVSGIKTLEVRSGAVWLTGTPATGDIVLSAGERLELTDQWPFVIQALSSAELANSSFKSVTFPEATLSAAKK